MWPGDPQWTGAQRTRHLLQNSQPPSAAPPVSELTSGTAATDERRTPGSGLAEKWKGNTPSVETSLTHSQWSKPKMQTNQKPKTLKQRFFIDFLAPFLHDQLPETTLLLFLFPFRCRPGCLQLGFSPALTQEGAQLLEEGRAGERRALTQQGAEESPALLSLGSSPMR